MPLKSGKSCEVAVIGVDSRAIFESNGGNPNIRHDVARRTNIESEFFDKMPVTFARIKDSDMWQRQPRVNDLCSLSETRGPRMNSRMSHEAKKSVD